MIDLPRGLAPADVTTFSPYDPDDLEWVGGDPVRDAVRVIPYDPEWPTEAAALIARIRAALPDEVALSVQHIGSTSVPGLAAKDVIDLDLEVPDPAAEDSYVPSLEATGFRLRLREPNWFGHRLLVESTGRRVNLHVFAAGAAELVRHRLLRDHLRSHPDDRALYERAKRAGAAASERQLMTEYTQAKEPILHEIYARAFAEAGLA